MKKQLKLKSIALFLFTAVFITSCDDNNDIDLGEDPGDGDGEVSEFDGELSVFHTGSDARAITIDAASLIEPDVATVKVSFTSDDNMKRLYITKNASGFGAEPLSFSDDIPGIEVDDKKDGSLDLTGSNSNEFNFSIPFPIPATTDSNVVYTIWATTGRGDFRDVSKRNAISDTAMGTITITGSGNSSGNGINTFSGTLLAAPFADGTSETFISLFNNEVYKISEGEEFAALWDFGYYYGNTQKASLSSASDYPKLFDVNGDGVLESGVAGVTGVAQEELNNFYMKASTLDFDAVTSASDLDGIVASTSETITALAIGDVIEFVDEYGNKGLIKVTGITDGFSGSIEFDVKVQY